MRIVVGITGATGAVFGIRTLECLADMGVETHLILSRWGARTVEHETPYTVAQVRQLATVSYSFGDQAAEVSSGSFRTDGMIIAPCSMKTLAAIANGLGADLVSRAADVILKEQRKLVLLVRETPLSSIHLRNMLELAQMGVSIVPPVPAFYNQPQSIADLVDHIVFRTLDQFGLDAPGVKRWDGQLRHQADPVLPDEPSLDAPHTPEGTDAR